MLAYQFTYHHTTALKGFVLPDAKASHSPENRRHHLAENALGLPERSLSQLN